MSYKQSQSDAKPAASLWVFAAVLRRLKNRGQILVFPYISENRDLTPV